MSSTDQHELPGPVLLMISATNAGDSEQFLAAFARDAVLNDWGRVFKGRDRIAAWNAAENIGVNSKITVTAVTRVEGGHVTLGVNVSGDGYTGPGTFDIEVASAQITSMTIH